MRCETCHGKGWVFVDHQPVVGVMPGDPDRPPHYYSLKQPCPDCGGCGITHCCEGERPEGTGCP